MSVSNQTFFFCDPTTTHSALKAREKMSKTSVDTFAGTYELPDGGHHAADTHITP